MKKYILNAGAIALVAAIAGCSGTQSAQPSAEGVAAAQEEKVIAVSEHMKPKAIKKAIERAGEGQGWIVTTINERSSVASKYVDGKSASVVVHYGRSGITFEKNRTTMSDSEFADEVENLEDAIEAALKHSSDHH
jgi:hypothetical protein